MDDHKKQFHLAGDVLATTIQQLAAILVAGNWRVRCQEDELELDDDDWSIAIYASRAASDKTWNFLVSGELEGTRDEVSGVVTSIFNLLKSHNIVCNFEYYDRHDPEEQLVIRHQDF